MDKNKYRIKMEDSFGAWVAVQERHWWGWKDICEYSVNAWGISKAISKAKLTIKELSKLDDK